MGIRCSPTEGSYKATFSNMQITECKWESDAARQKAHIRQHFQICRLRNVNGNQMQTGVIDDMISKDKSYMRIIIS